MPNNQPMIRIGTLNRIYREFLSQPLKLFVARDFGQGGSWRKYLKCLVSLGLIEEVKAVQQVTRKGVRCYKLIPLKRIELKEWLEEREKEVGSDD